MNAAITRIAGALVEAGPCAAALYELAYVGERRLLAEVVRQERDVATLQVYEDTTGLRLGAPVEFSGTTLTAQLGPGLLGSVLDGVGRPLARVAEATGDFIAPGTAADTLDAGSLWSFTAAVPAGADVAPGDVLGAVPESQGFSHQILVPPHVRGRVAHLATGSYHVDDPIGALDDGTPLHLAHRWPVRIARPLAERLGYERPFVTGQRVFDLFFPVAEGGNAIVPGGFGTGKTIIEQSLARHADADIIVYVGCGERGNEMTDVLTEFPALVDPRTGRALMERAVLVANTSNMPVAAREASIYFGVTIAEYFRDQGHRVALMIDSASRWAEALREMAARLQEMPGEEGYPTYLASRLGQFFERAGRARALGAPERRGAVTIIGAVSPPGGDFSEPVTQASLRVAGAMWALDPSLAHQRHFPAVDWETSYSLYVERIASWFAEHGGERWSEVRVGLMNLMQHERELRDIASLVGPDALEDTDRLTMDCAAMVREIVLRQNAYHPHDAASSVAKTYAMAACALDAHRAGEAALGAGIAFARLDLSPVWRALAALRDAPEHELEPRAREAREAVQALAPRPPGGSHP
ncbi:MAG TPA: V-type ATP synthase subunit A [Gemmatimonadaceae bacterium]|nr:V-type ATP synthase subunit A [Gemmatimonadaceae bacterium]